MVGSVLRTGLPSVLDKVSLTSPPTVGHRHQKSQQMQQQNAASHAYNVQSPTVTQNDSKLGIPRNFMGFFKITRDSEEYHTQATKDVLFCKHVNTDIYSSSFLTQTPVYPL